MVTGGIWRPDSLPLYSRSGVSSGNASGSLPNYSRKSSSSADGTQQKLNSSRGGQPTRKRGKRRRRLSRTGRFVVVILLLLVCLWLVVLWRWMAVPATSSQSGDLHVVLDQQSAGAREPVPPVSSDEAPVVDKPDNEGDPQSRAERGIDEKVPTVHKTSVVKPEVVAPAAGGQAAVGSPAAPSASTTSSSSPSPGSQEASASQEAVDGEPGATEETKESSHKDSVPPQSTPDMSQTPPSVSELKDTETATPKPSVASSVPAPESTFATESPLSGEQQGAPKSDLEAHAPTLPESSDLSTASESKVKSRVSPLETSPEQKPASHVENRESQKGMSDAAEGDQRRKVDTEGAGAVEHGVPVKDAHSEAEGNRQKEIREAAGVRARQVDNRALASERREQLVMASEPAVGAGASRQARKGRDAGQEKRAAAHAREFRVERVHAEEHASRRAASLTAARREPQVSGVHPQASERAVRAAKADHWGLGQLDQFSEEESDEDLIPEWPRPSDPRGLVPEGPGLGDARHDSYRMQPKGRVDEVPQRRWSPVFSEERESIAASELKRAPSRGAPFVGIRGRNPVGGVLTEGAFGGARQGRHERFAAPGMVLPNTPHSNGGRPFNEWEPQGVYGVGAQRRFHENYGPEATPKRLEFRVPTVRPGFVRGEVADAEAVNRATAHAFWAAQNPQNAGVVRRERPWVDEGLSTPNKAPFYAHDRSHFPVEEEESDSEPSRQGEMALPVAARAPERTNFEPPVQQREAAPQALEGAERPGKHRSRQGEGNLKGHVWGWK
ncbi:putative transmembrane protein [Toxoplasma gondii TgCatPRC2]|uniref:Putative transmembrane protein n=1 Tax=Toxoplasma gondii TgCatPRC2 TaxID=1130821 RepID=A0A151H4Q3_TOXGO|nr:putative transmembrane protein [Toxoplasma gondii TgCatPRC2]